MKEVIRVAANKRGKNPPKSVTDKLYIRAGGRCQLCNKDVLTNNVHCKEINHGNIAHIVASSMDGPRGNDKSFELSQKLDNLMLLCPECHKYIDDNPNYYTEEKLYEIKITQERIVSDLLDSLNKQKTMFLIFSSAIKNENKVHIDRNEVIDAIIDSGLIPNDKFGMTCNIDLYDEYKTQAYWINAEKAIEQKVLELQSILNNSDVVLSIFPLAPIPMIIKLGNLLSDKRHVDIYQKYREPDTWKWLSKDLTNSFSFEKKVFGSGNKIALVISITAEIDLQRVVKNDKYDVIYHLRAEKFGVNAIQSTKDLQAFWIRYLEVCDLIKNKDRVDEISLFSAVPVSVAFEIGRRYMPNVYPKMRIFDENHGFFETFTIGGGNNE